MAAKNSSVAEPGLGANRLDIVEDEGGFMDREGGFVDWAEGDLK